MTRLTKASLANRTVVVLLSLLTIGLGVFAAGALKQELIPSIDLPRGSILTVYPGATPSVVEAQLSKPIETAVKAVPGVIGVTSKSSSGVSQVSVEWEYGIKPDDMAADLQAAVDGIPGGLPANVDPRVITGSFDDVPVSLLALSSNDDLEVLSNKVNDIVVPDLKALPGVREVMVAGEETREVVITYRQGAIEKYGVDPTSIAGIFAANSTAFPSGTVRSDTGNLDVQTGTTLASVADIENLQIPATDGPVRLGDIAKVVEQPVETTSVSRVGGKPSLTVSVVKESDANTVTVANSVTARIPDLERALGNGATFSIILDQAPYIETSIKDLSVEGGIGLAMAVLIILVFLGSIRPTIITAISIPLSLLIALVGLWLGGNSLNTLTLGALTVAIGRVVDDSIVVIENIKRRQGRGEFGARSIIEAVQEVAGAITSSTLTTVAVFLPIGLVGGQAGQIFRPFATTVTISLLASLLVSLTVVPVLASWFMKPGRKALADVEPAEIEEDEEQDTWLQKAYLPALNWSLAHRGITLALALGVFVGTLALAPQLKTDFLGQQGNESLAISQTMPAGSSLAETDAAARRIEAALAADPAVQTYTTSIGGQTSVFMGTQADTNQATYSVPLKAGQSAKNVVGRIRKAIADLGPGVGSVDVSIGASGAGSGLVVYVETADSQALEEANAMVVNLMKGIPDLTNVKSDLSEDRELLQIDVKEEAAAKNGMTQTSIGQAVSRAVRGQQIGNLTKGEDTLKVYLRSQAPVKNIEELRKIKLPVTQVMNINAKTEAGDKVTARSEKLQAEGKAAAADAYRQQVKQLRKSIKAINAQIAAAERCKADPSTCQAPDPVKTLEAQRTALYKQIDALATARSKTLESQAKQQEIVDAGKAAGEATADPIELNAVATVSLVKAPAMITRVDGIRAATVSASSESSDLGATTALLRSGLADLELPQGVSVRIGGVSQAQADSFAQLGLAMAIAVAVVYLIMVATFGSLLQPLILLVSIPFAATGALGLSLLTGTALGVPSMIGLLMLIGIVVTNAIVLIDLINQKRKAGEGVSQSIREGARLRLRPIIMTALATIFALIPMALGLTGGGVFISKPLGIVVIGGLLSSTLLTLILVPVLYDLLESSREKRALKRAQRRGEVATTGEAPAGGASA